MGAKVERIERQGLAILKDLCVRCTPPITERVPPGILEKFYSTTSLFVERIPAQPLKNLKFAIKTILEWKGEVISEDKVEWLAQQTIKNFLGSIFEVSRILNRPDDLASYPNFIKPEISDEVRDFLSQKGIIASFHSGNPFAATHFFKELVATRDVAGFMEKQPTVLQERLGSFVDLFGFVPVFRDEAKMYEKIKRADFLITLFDRPVKNGSSGVEVNFFGKPARFLKGPAILSLRLGRPILPVAIVKAHEGGYTAEIGNIVSPKDYQEIKNLKERERELLRAVLAEMEHIIAKHPTSHFSFFERFWVEQS